MSTDHEETMAALEGEKLLAQLKGVRLENVGRGKLSLTNKRIQFENKGRLFSPPHLAFSVDLWRVSSAKFKDSSESLVLEWLDDNGKPVVSRLSLPGGDAATNLCRSLGNILKLMRREAELQERRASYQAFLWKTAYQVWVMVGLLVQIVRGLTREDWDAVDASLSEARETSNALSLEGAMDIAEPVQTLSETVTSRDAPLVLRRVTATLEAIGTSLQEGLPPGGEWEDLSPENLPGLNWRDMRYIFLFAGRYKLLSLWQQLGENKRVEDSLPRLARLSSVLADRIPMESELGRSSREGEALNITSSIEVAARNLENSLKMNAGTA